MMQIMERFGPVVDVLVLMLPGVELGAQIMEAWVDEFVRGVFEVCADREYQPPHVRWTISPDASTGYVIMDARLDTDTLRRLWLHGKVYRQEYRLHRTKDREEMAQWMAARQPDAEGWR